MIRYYIMLCVLSWILKCLCLLLLVLCNGFFVSSGCPEICFCYERMINCSGRNLTTLPSNITSETKSLLLDFNNFENVPDLSFIPNIEVLSMAYNSLETLEGTKTLIKLKKLNVSHNIIPSVSRSLFENHTQLEILDLSYNQLKNIDGLKHSFPRLKLLSVDHNKLEDLDAIRNGKFPSLQILKAGHNEISDLVVNKRLLDFGEKLPFPKLTTLELNNNKIRQIHLYLKKFVHLKKLVLSYNRIERITLYTFLKNDDLEELYLDHNNITEVTNSLFAFTTKLLRIDLSFNQIKRIGMSSFKNTVDIKHIDLSHNKLPFVHSRTFEYLRNLTTINLHNNHISHVSSEAFEAMNSLSYLNISRNEVSIGEKEFDAVFLPLKSLITLDLSDNNILLVPNHAFAGLKSLRALYLKGNAIKYIEPSAFNNLNNITDLYLETNNLDCDCSIKWFRGWLKSRNLLKGPIIGICLSPVWLKGKNMMTILDTELTCVKHDKSHSIRPTVVQHPRSVYGYLKGNVTFACAATSSVETALIIEWYRDHQIVRNVQVRTSLQRRVGSHLFTRSSQLVIRNVQFTDQGRYWCKVRNMYGSDVSHYANMTVIVPPVMSTNLKDEIIVNSGEDVLIPCSAEGIPTPVLHFTKRTSDSFHAVIEKRIVFRDNMFGIQNLKIEDSGIYACTAKSKAGTANFTIHIVVNEKPKFIRAMKSKNIELGTAAVLDCIVSGNPRPVITWSKDGVRMRETSRLKVTDQMLIVKSFQEKDVGTYSCLATNKLGTAVQSTSLSIRLKGDNDVTNSSNMNSRTFIAVIVLAVVAAVILTSLFWYMLIKYCRKWYREKQVKKQQKSPIFSHHPNDSSCPDLPENFTLRRNGRLVSIPNQSEENVVLNDSIMTASSCFVDALNYLKEQQADCPKYDTGAIPLLQKRVTDNNTMLSEDDVISHDDVSEREEDDTEHDSGVLVHYKSSGNLRTMRRSSNAPEDCLKRSKGFITIDISDKDDRDRRKDGSPRLTDPLRSSSVSSKLQDYSLDPKPLSKNNKNTSVQCHKPKQPHRRKLSLQNNDGEYFHTYLTSSSGIESGANSSTETLSVNDHMLETTA